MYLMALGNIDYIVATIFFAIIFLISYLFRRKQQTVNQFLFGSDEVLLSPVNNWILGFGVIELVSLGAVGALNGVSGLYYVLVTIFVAYLISYYISRSIYPHSIYEYIGKKCGAKFSAIYAILCVVLLLFLGSITVVLTSKVFLSLLGWRFVNSVFGITILTILCAEVGGYKGISYNRKIWLGLISLSFIAIVGFAFYELMPISDKFMALAQLATSQGKNPDFYTSIHYSSYLKNITAAAISILLILPFITASKTAKRANSIFVGMIKIGAVVVIVICGILAIATPVKNIQGAGDSKIVTYQVQLADGQTGYVVKAVDNKGAKANPVPGIIPPLLNPKTNLVETGKYDYKLSSVVMLRHYLPARLLVVLVLVIIAAFMYALSLYLLSIAKIVTLDICLPLDILKEYKEEGALWCARMSMIFAGGISIFGGYFLQYWFELSKLAYILFTFAGCLGLTLIVIIAMYGKK